MDTTTIETNTIIDIDTIEIIRKNTIRTIIETMIKNITGITTETTIETIAKAMTTIET